eukprot:8169799-Alexandrium_andersonii.AAC.1
MVCGGWSQTEHWVSVRMFQPKNIQLPKTADSATRRTTKHAMATESRGSVPRLRNTQRSTQ